MIKLFKRLKCIFTEHIIKINIYPGNIFYTKSKCENCNKNITPIIVYDAEEFELKEFFK